MVSSIHVIPSIVKIIHKLKIQRDIFSVADEIVEIHPEIIRSIDPAIYMPGEIDKIIAVDEFSNFEIQEKRIKQTQRLESATKIYRYKNAIFHKSTIYSNYNRLKLSSDREPNYIFDDFEKISDALLSSDWLINRFFGHWLREGLLKECLANELGLTPICNQKNPWLHEHDYRRILNLPRTAFRSIRVKDLWIPDDRGLNYGWESRLTNLRNIVKISFSNEINGSRKYVFLKRGSTGSKRQLLNENAVINFLEKIGFTILDPEKMLVEEIIRSLIGAKIAIAVEGSAHNHLLYVMPEGSAYICIQPPQRFNAAFKAFCDVNKMKYAFLVGQKVGDGFTINENDISHIIDLINI